MKNIEVLSSGIFAFLVLFLVLVSMVAILWGIVALFKKLLSHKDNPKKERARQEFLKKLEKKRKDHN